jgi:hypothetical protein
MGLCARTKTARAGSRSHDWSDGVVVACQRSRASQTLDGGRAHINEQPAGQAGDSLTTALRALCPHTGGDSPGPLSAVLSRLQVVILRVRHHQRRCCIGVWGRLASGTLRAL